jgi:hypothetical protein
MATEGAHTILPRSDDRMPRPFGGAPPGFDTILGVPAQGVKQNVAYTCVWPGSKSLAHRLLRDTCVHMPAMKLSHVTVTQAAPASQPPF